MDAQSKVSNSILTHCAVENGTGQATYTAYAIKLHHLVLQRKLEGKQAHHAMH